MGFFVKSSLINFVSGYNIHERGGKLKNPKAKSKKYEPIKFDEVFKKLFTILSNNSIVRFVNFVYEENIH